MRDPINTVTNTFWPMVVEQTTRGERGYVVTDTDVAPSDAALASLRQSPETVWLRSWRA